MICNKCLVMFGIRPHHKGHMCPEICPYFASERIKELEAEKRSWRRVAEKLEQEKQSIKRRAESAESDWQLAEERIKELEAEIKSARAKYDIYKGVAEQKVQEQAERTKELEGENKKRRDAIICFLDRWKKSGPRGSAQWEKFGFSIQILEQALKG